MFTEIDKQKWLNKLADASLPQNERYATYKHTDIPTIGEFLEDMWEDFHRIMEEDGYYIEVPLKETEIPSKDRNLSQDNQNPECDANSDSGTIHIPALDYNAFEKFVSLCYQMEHR